MCDTRWSTVEMPMALSKQLQQDINQLKQAVLNSVRTVEENMLKDIETLRSVRRGVNGS